MTLEQLYISSLNIPAIQIKILKNLFKVEFKAGRILSNAYITMLKSIPHHDSFVIFRHSQTLYTFCFIKSGTAYLIGPEILNYTPDDQEFNQDYKIIYMSKRLNTTILERDQCYKQILFFSELIQHPVDETTIDAAFQNAKASNQMNNIITTVNFTDKGVHISYVYEQALKSAVMLGDTSAIHDTLIRLIHSGRIGILSDKGRVRSVKNWGIICVSVTLRSAIKSGMDYDQAYSLNDEYIRTLEQLGSFDEVMQKIEEILVDMATRVQHLHNVHLSKNVRYVYQTIVDSPESSPTPSEFSNQLGVSQHYLGKIFKSEIGVTITRFKILIKVNRVIQLIQITNFPLSRIAEILRFADQSHLTREFKDLVGVTPSAVRKNPHLTNEWSPYQYLKINVG